MTGLPARYACQPREGWIPPAFVVVDMVTGLTVHRSADQADALTVAKGMNAGPGKRVRR